MKRFAFLSAFLIAALMQAALAQQPQPLNEASLLWEVSGNGLQKPSYVYGTIHLIGQKDFFLTDATRSSLNQASRVIFEINLDKMMDLTAMLPMLTKSFMKNDTTLRDLLSQEEYQIVKQHFQKLGLPIFMLERIKPMFLSAMDPESMLNPAGGREATVSYEMELMKLAKEAGKKIDGLETMAFQMSMFDSIPYRTQARMLVETIRKSDAGEGEESGESEFARMVEMYKQQDIEGMQRMIHADEELSSFENVLLANRNRNWIPIMRNMMNKETCFFAVGAGHLGGENGVIQLLRLEGFTLRALK